ncbi:MAG TPA: phage terminase large subunit [Candidatus Enterousia avicola]|uniref:Phage terminase large subunit n=1 Tax=Candidatus Enterousia avicola TaxID=2840787 RepID=A0A9D1MR97_9PROT|nr:phage terminase large subunit [Candidatus Enterousia avicola]
MKLEFPALVNFIERFPEEIRDKYRQYFTNDCVQVETIIEDTSSGTAIIQFLQSKGIRVRPIKSETDKETRLTGITHLLENGTILLPNQQNGDLVDFFDELFKFPNSTFKDMVDSFSQGVRYIDDSYISGSRGYF